MAEIVHIPLGGGGGSATDRFEATVIIGNTAEGDPAASQALPFNYRGDTGNGDELVAAIAAALGSGQSTRIRVRPGAYDLSGQTLPISIPSNVILEGSGTQTLFFGSDTSREVFDVQESAIVRDFYIFVPSEGETPAGEYVMRFAQNSLGERIRIQVGDGGGGQDSDSLQDLFRIWGNDVRLLDVIGDVQSGVSEGSPTISCVGIGPRQSGPTIQRATVRLTTLGLGAQLFVSSQALDCLLDVSGDGGRIGNVNGTRLNARIMCSFLTPGGAVPNFVDWGAFDSIAEITGHGDGVDLSDYATISGFGNNLRIQFDGASGGGAVSVTGEFNAIGGGIQNGNLALVVGAGNRNMITGLRVSGGDLDVDGDGNIVIGNQVVAPGAINDTGAGNTVAANIVV